VPILVQRPVLEAKGSDEILAKRTFLDERVRTVNANAGFGTWASDVSHSVDRPMLEKHSAIWAI
jgi:hypothetical protein